MRWLAPWLLVPLLAACGLIPLPEQTLPDFDIVASTDNTTPANVLYQDLNQLDALDAPQLPYRDLELFATVTYRGASSRLRVELFFAPARPDCPVVPATRPGFTDVLVCDGPSGGRPVGEFVLPAGLPVLVRVAGAGLDEGVRSGVLYAGTRLLEGSMMTLERISVQQIRVRGRL